MLALKSTAGPPDLLLEDLFEPGGGYVGGRKKIIKWKLLLMISLTTSF